MDVTADTREYRMYRRIDDGPLMLMKQAFRTVGAAESICYDDYALSDGVAIGAYYGQLINDQGNSGPLVLLGRREIVRNPPKPLLAPIIASGTAAAPTMTLRWFCKPGGIERFQVWICADPPLANEPFSTGVSPVFSTNRLVVTARAIVNVDGLPEECAFGDMHYSPRVGSTELGNGPLFTLPLNVRSGVTYNFFVRPITGAGVLGPPSNGQKFKWTAPAEVGTVPWPARGLPKTEHRFQLMPSSRGRCALPTARRSILTVPAWREGGRSSSYPVQPPGVSHRISALILPGRSEQPHSQGQSGQRPVSLRALSLSSGQRRLPPSLGRSDQVSPLMERIWR